MVRVQTKVNNKKASCKVIYLHPKLKLFYKFVHHSTCYITALGCTRSNCSCCLFSWRSSLLKLHSSLLSLNFFSDFSLRHHMVFWAELFIFLSDNFELLSHSSLFHLSVFPLKCSQVFPQASPHLQVSSLRFLQVFTSISCFSFVLSNMYCKISSNSLHY